MENKRKRDWRDRSDRLFVKNQDSLHILMPYLMPGRTNNEAVLTDIIDIARIKEYVDRRNAENPSYKYSWFQIITAAIAKTIYLRPKMNYFISGHRLYERRNIECAFVVKRTFDDHSEETEAKWIVDLNGGSPIEQMHTYLENIVTKVRVKKELDHTSQSMDFFKHIPGFVTGIIAAVLRFLESFGWYPKAFQIDDPIYSSVFISNLGSIKMQADYHHIFNWGTNSFFVVISEMKKRLIINDDNSTEIKDTVKLAFTIDERIADGYYFAQSIKLLRYLLQNPELLEKDFKEPVEMAD